MNDLPFTSRMSRGETIAALVWLPVHLLLLPLLLGLLVTRGLVSGIIGNLLVYAIGAAYFLLTLRRFLRREFDALCDHPFLALFSVIGGYLLAVFGEGLATLLLESWGLAGTGENNEAVMEMMRENLGPAAAMGVFLAPIVEECLFRGLIFGSLRRKNRALAYVVSIALFSLYHVWQGALNDPKELLFALQYIPASLALALVYDRSNSLWTAIFLHLVTNGLAVLALGAL